MNVQQPPAEYTAAEDSGSHLEDLVVDRVEPRKVANLLLWLIVGFFVVFALWASFAQIDRSVYAQGRIVPGSQLQVISNLEGGIVEAILVETGDEVRQGQPLIRLDQTERSAEFGSNAVTAASLQAKIARLEAQLAGRAPRYPSASSAAMGEAIAIEQSLYLAQMAELSSLTAAAEARVTQANRAVAEANANYDSAVSQIRNYEQQADVMRPLVERGIEPRLTLIQLESQAAVARSQAAAAQAAAARARAGVSEATSALSQARQDWRARVATELADAQARFAALRRTLPALQDRVDRSVVTAPLDGTINRVLVATVGGSVPPGAPLVELVPSGDSLLIEARLLPKDVGFIRLGQDARINVTAYESAVYGTLDGNVVSISPDATVDEETGTSFYIVRVRAEGALTDQDGNKLELGPGMTVDVALLGDKRSVMSYILSPLTRIGQRALRE